MGSIARLRRAVFARHCHPCSAWTRWASTPLILVPAWTRRRSHAVWLAVWLAVNPFVFGKPRQLRAWSTRAMLCEELWISRRRPPTGPPWSAGWRRRQRWSLWWPRAGIGWDPRRSPPCCKCRSPSSIGSRWCYLEREHQDSASPQ